MIRKKYSVRLIARCMLLTMAYQLLYPCRALALTSGPTQPEVQSFEPVGTTDMIDLFTGDFVYNIPLLDVEGYPINISYHGGIGMEQEATWVGLGWNINPGAINKNVRGVPDDFNGDTLKKEYHIKNEEMLRLGLETGLETVGLGDPSLINLNLSLGNNLNISNYRGISADFTFGCGINLARSFSAGVNIGVGSQSGASVDPYAGFGIASSQILGTGVGVGINRNISHGYNTRTGLKDLSLSTGVSVGGSGGTISTKTIPVSVSNYVPVLTNTSKMTSGYGRLKFGVEFAWCNLWGSMKGMWSKVEHSDEGASRKSYGYMYSENADLYSIHDFTRDKDGLFNPNMSYLPMASMTYDVYTVSGQGTGGSFRPFRNDYGSVYDPIVFNQPSINYSAQLEGSIGWLFAIGMDLSFGVSLSKSGPWSGYVRPFASAAEPENEDLFEKVYFKQAGELNAVNDSNWSRIGGYGTFDLNRAMSLPQKKPGTGGSRQVRTAPVGFLTANEAANYDGVAQQKQLHNYSDTFGGGQPMPTTSINRNAGVRKGHHISEISQIQADGRKYVYGLPVMNNIQREATFAIASGTVADQTGLAPYVSQDDSKSNNNLIDQYYSSTITPGNAHSYLITSVLSNDYIDITGNGPTDDDLGGYNKFNYSLKSSDYRWRAPYDRLKVQHEAGYLSDPWDEKGSYVIGSREQWLLHSIESKNYIAEFYTSAREDGKGSSAGIKGGGDYEAAKHISTQSSYKLDSIKLYNKHDRYINKMSAIPVKTVFLQYDYSLSGSVPNSSNGGKLTLKKIYTRYGNSNKSIASPYQFTYSSSNPVYNAGEKDRWGNYKKTLGMSNMDFPFVNQFDNNIDSLASSWSLTEIGLPSGGVIKVAYEADDYAYVQSRRAMEMFKIEGVGMSPAFMPGNILYNNASSPNLFLYFKRRVGSESSGSAKENYLSGTDLLYFNSFTRLKGNKYEKIKGYAKVEEVGYCNSEYGYVKLKYITPVGKGKLNPIAYTAVNVGRYNLPHILYDGFDPGLNVNSILSILKGLKASFEDLLNLWKNPVIVLMNKKNVGKDIELSKSYIRLTSPGFKKKGGGHRVKTLSFYDSWHTMAGTDAQQAVYGKNYDYTIDGPGDSEQSSGVASYEPIIGGDENPYRLPVPYRAQNSSNFPPNDAVDLYQEEPIGESLFPPAVVGYQKVTVSSIHMDTGRSSQRVDVYTFYTAKEHPIRVQSTSLHSSGENKSGIFKQKNSYNASQGFTITLNDMHGKPRSVEQYVRKVKGSSTKLEKVMSRVYKYATDNRQQVIENSVNGTAAEMKNVTNLLGVEADITVDSREKIEITKVSNINTNLNVTNILFVVVPIPMVFPWKSDATNEFRSATTTKIIQKYGILEEVEIYHEGAMTILKNEVFDAITGQPVITSVNNEFQDKEYTVNYPAYWGYKDMGPSYINMGYEYHADTLTPSNNMGVAPRLPLNTLSNKMNFNNGDEVYVRYKDSSATVRSIIGYIHYGGYAQVENSNCCYPIVLPKFSDSAAYIRGWYGANVKITDVFIKVIKPGRKNFLHENMQSYTGFNMPFSAGTITNNLTEVININAKQFGESRLVSHVTGSSKLDSFSNGSKGVYRPIKEFAYHNNRPYTSDRTRKAGVFTVSSYWQPMGSYVNISCPVSNPNEDCSLPNSIYRASFMAPVHGSNWIQSSEVSKWSPYATEVENKDPLGNKSTAVYGYNEELPVAVAYNASQGEVLMDGFEDYLLLTPEENFMNFIYSPFKYLFPKINVSGTTHKIYDISSGTAGIELNRNIAHSGLYSLKTSGSQLQVILGKLSALSPSIYEKFKLSNQTSKSYVLSYWSRPNSISSGATTYTTNGATVPNQIAVKKSNIIDGWQQVEYIFRTSSSATDTLQLPANCHIDDVRIFPLDANMKSFVYHPVNKKLMATLDENNYATFYEYDAEGNLIRTKRETENGIITISESRSANKKS